MDPQRLRREIVGRDQASILKLARPVPQGDVCPSCDTRQSSWAGGIVVAHHTRTSLWRYFICAQCARRIWDEKGHVRDDRGRRRLQLLTEKTNVAIALLMAAEEYGHQLHGKLTLSRN